MPSHIAQLENRGAGWLFEWLGASRSGGRLSRWWHWLLMSLGVCAGCSSVPKPSEFAAHPIQSTNLLMTEAADQLRDKLELEPRRRQRAPACPLQPIPQPSLVAAAVEEVPPPPAASPTAVAQPVGPSQVGAPQQNVFRSATAPSPIAPPEPLPTQTISASRPVPVVSPAVDVQNVQWCRVRVRNIGPHSASQVVVGVASPSGGQLLWNDAHVGPTVAGARLDFPAIAQVASQAEQILVVGIRATDESQRRLRLQVRDAQGGSHQDIQNRWQVSIEPLETP